MMLGSNALKLGEDVATRAMLLIMLISVNFKI